MKIQTATNSLRLHVQSATVQAQPATLVEEGIRGITPSSLEISLPTKPRQHRQTSRLPTLNVTLSNIERHAKTRVNRAKNTIQKPNQRLKHKQKSRTFTTKKIFQTHTNRLWLFLKPLRSLRKQRTGTQVNNRHHNLLLSLNYRTIIRHNRKTHKRPKNLLLINQSPSRQLSATRQRIIKKRNTIRPIKPSGLTTSSHIQKTSQLIRRLKTHILHNDNLLKRLIRNQNVILQPQTHLATNLSNSEYQPHLL